MQVGTVEFGPGMYTANRASWSPTWDEWLDHMSNLTAHHDRECDRRDLQRGERGSAFLSEQYA